MSIIRGLLILLTLIAVATYAAWLATGWVCVSIIKELLGL